MSGHFTNHLPDAHILALHSRCEIVDKAAFLHCGLSGKGIHVPMLDKTLMGPWTPCQDLGITLNIIHSGIRAAVNIRRRQPGIQRMNHNPGLAYNFFFGAKAPKSIKLLQNETGGID